MSHIKAQHDRPELKENESINDYSVAFANDLYKHSKEIYQKMLDKTII